MYDSMNEILSKIKLGEDSSIEFKSVRFKGNKPDLSRDDLADEISAFANASEGTILFGIDDKTKFIEGIPLDKIDIMETFLRNIVNDSINPPAYVKILKLELPDIEGNLKPIIKLDIPKSLFVHKSTNGYFRRIGSSKREMPPDILARLFQQRSQARIIRFDEQPVPDTSEKLLNKDLWIHFVDKVLEPETILLEKLKIITLDDTGEYRLSVAGVLIATDNPSNYLSNAIIEAVCYKGLIRDSNYQQDAVIISGPLNKQIEKAIDFIRKNMKVGAIKDPGRIEIPQYSIRACFEAVVNAAAHRDYSIHGSKIRIFMFDDRLEIYSPGAIPNTMTIESLPLRQSTRNELITSFLAKIPLSSNLTESQRSYLMDKRGEGVPIIISESEKISGKRPEYKIIDDSELLLTIFSYQ